MESDVCFKVVLFSFLFVMDTDFEDNPLKDYILSYSGNTSC